jgi:hypothetical protein
MTVDEGGAVYVVWHDNYAIRASDGTWSGPLGIYRLGICPQVQVDEQGAMHVVGLVDATPDDIYYHWRASDGTWSGSQNISSSSGDTYCPLLALDRNGAAHVVWRDDTSGSGDIYYSRRGSDGIWIGARNISVTSGASLEPQLAVEGNGAAHVVWYDETSGNGDISYAWRGSDGFWSSSQNISNMAGSSHSPQLAVYGNGTVHVVWSENSSGRGDIYYCERSPNGKWSSPQNISNTAGRSGSPQLAVSGSGTVHVVWSDLTPGHVDIYHAWRRSDGTWSTPGKVSNSSAFSFAPIVVVDGKETPHAMWVDENPCLASVYYARGGSGGTWSSPCLISDPSAASDSSRLVVDEKGLVHIVWQAYESPLSKIYYTNWEAGHRQYLPQVVRRH